jgi:SPP1 family predicted phage head-tail adaptor
MLATSVPVGKLDRRITIQEPVYGTNEHNEKVISSWSNVATVWARVEQKQGSEVVDADRLTYYETTIFTIRYRSDLNVQMRIIWDSIPYRIFSITEHKAARKGYMEIAAEVIDNETVVIDGGAFSEEEFSEAFSS